VVPSLESLQRSLDWLPTTLEDMYNGMLLDHSLRSGVSQEFQLTILAWVTHSSRPLRLLELADMLDTESGKKGKDTKAIVRLACGPLLEILEDETVSVIHHSFTEYLTDTSRGVRPAPGSRHAQFPIIASPNTHRKLTLACLKYLTSGCLSSPQPIHTNRGSARQQAVLKLQHPFLDYATKNLTFHFGKLDYRDDELCSQLDSFMKPGTDEFSAWLELSLSCISNYKNGHLTQPLHIAAMANMLNYAKYILEKNSDANVLDGYGKTPLLWAASKGHAEVTALLLKTISNPDIEDHQGNKPLHYAARGNHSLVVRQLLLAGVSPLTPKTKENPGRRCGNAPRTKGETPLSYAIRSGSIETVREMIPYLKETDLNVALYTASKSGQAEIVELLLSQPKISVDTPDLPNTPLFLAACVSNPKIIKFLLDKGADPLKRSKNFHDFSRTNSNLLRRENHSPMKSAFHGLIAAPQYRSDEKLAMAEDIEASFNLLLQAGCNINDIDECGKTPLHCSVAFRSTDQIKLLLIELLLKNGADFTIRDECGNAPLHLADLHYHKGASAVLLLDYGADVAARRPSDGRTPLHTMMESVYTSDVKPLVPYVPDWDITDCYGNTAAHIALEKSHYPQAIIKDMIGAGANLNLKNKRGLAPIHSVKGYTKQTREIIQTLANGGVDLEIRDTGGRTPFLRAILRSGYSDGSLSKCLQDTGANILAMDNFGNGTLHILLQNHGVNSVTLESLIATGLDSRHVNYEGNTLLHELAKNYKVAYMGMGGDALEGAVSLLLKLGVPAGVRNNNGWTAMHFACASLPFELPGDCAGNSHSLEVFMSSELAESIDSEDNNGVRPIHLSATISEVCRWSIPSIIIKVELKTRDHISV
jgi:ankyrin repeat protein